MVSARLPPLRVPLHLGNQSRETQVSVGHAKAVNAPSNRTHRAPEVVSVPLGEGTEIVTRPHQTQQRHEVGEVALRVGVNRDAQRRSLAHEGAQQIRAP